MSYKCRVGDAYLEMEKLLPDSFHCCVTSPPYYRQRDYGVEGQIGLEPTADEYVETLVGVFDQVKRVLRDDGTLWLNLGDKMQDGELMGLPWQVALAMQQGGWWLRQEIIWHKPNCMTESAKHRPTRSHEQIFLFSKSQKYYYDRTAIMEPCVCVKKPGKKIADTSRRSRTDGGNAGLNAQLEKQKNAPPTHRNCRSVWTMPVTNYKGAHFAVFPAELPRKCILAGSPPQCCGKCGAPHVRETREIRTPTRPGLWQKEAVGNRDPQRHVTVVETVGWYATCKCVNPPVPARILDPFMGAGTTAVVAGQLGRDCVGIELNPEYARMSEERYEREGMEVAGAAYGCGEGFVGSEGSASEAA